MIDAYVDGRPMPSRSSSFTRLASEKRGGGSVKCCDGVIFFYRHVVADFHRRQRLLFLERFSAAVSLLARFTIHLLVAFELHHASRGPEQVRERYACEIEVHRGGVESRRSHLGSDEALPHELVKLELVGFQVTRDVLGPARRIRRPNRFMRILSVLGLAVTVELKRGGLKLLAVHQRDVLARLLGARFRYASRVRAHVRDESDRAFILSELDSLVQILREAHSALGSKAQLLRRFLLQRARGERRRGILSALATLHLGDAESLQLLEIGEDPVGRSFIVNRRFLVVDVMQLGREFLSFLLELRLDGPVLDGLERLDLALALDEKTKRHRLHATGGDSLLYSLPQHGARLVSNEAVENAARLLRVHFPFVDVTCARDCALHRVLRDLVKEDAPDGRAVLAAHLAGHVPGNRFSFTIRICREQNLA